MRISGTVRYFTESVYLKIKDAIDECFSGIEKEYGVKTSLNEVTYFRAVDNSKELADKARALLKEDACGFQPQFPSEDFSAYQRHTKGLFMFLGAGDGMELHSENFDFDESILIKGVEANCVF